MSKFYEQMMRHDAPPKRSIRRKAKHPLSTNPPKCEVCKRWLVVVEDHEKCREKAAAS